MQEIALNTYMQKIKFVGIGPHDGNSPIFPSLYCHGNSFPHFDPDCNDFMHGRIALRLYLASMIFAYSECKFSLKKSLVVNEFLNIKLKN